MLATGLISRLFLNLRHAFCLIPRKYIHVISSVNRINMFFCILFSLSVSVQENIDWDEEAIDDLDMGIIRLMPDTFGHSQKLFQKTLPGAR